MKSVLSNGFHIVNVFPPGKPFVEAYLCMKAHEAYDPSMKLFISSFMQKDFDRSLLDMSDHAVVFWGDIPSWVPMKTAASILFYPAINIVHEDAGPGVKKRIIELRNMSLLADIVIFVDNATRSRVGCNVGSFIGTIPYGSFNIMGPDPIGERPRPIRSFDVAMYGERTPKRDAVAAVLAKAFGTRFIHFDAYGRKRAEVAKDSYCTFHVGEEFGIGTSQLNVIQAKFIDSMSVVECNSNSIFIDRYFRCNVLGLSNPSSEENMVEILRQAVEHSKMFGSSQRHLMSNTLEVHASSPQVFFTDIVIAKKDELDEAMFAQ